MMMMIKRKKSSNFKLEYTIKKQQQLKSIKDEKKKTNERRREIREKQKTKKSKSELEGRRIDNEYIRI